MVLNPLVSLFGRLVARSGRIRGTGQTDGRTDGRNERVTLAAHARRGLIIVYRLVGILDKCSALWRAGATQLL